MRFATFVVLAFGLNSVCAAAPQESTEPLTVPAYHNQRTTEGYFQGAGGVRLFYRVVGRKGRPIVFLHGGPGLGLNDGGYDMEPLTDHGFRLMMFNERGAGRSEIITDQSKLRMEDFVEDVEEFRKQFGVEHFGLIGLSWGSVVALEYIAKYPDRVTRVLFLSPMPLTSALAMERARHLDSLKTDDERRQEKDAQEKFRHAQDADMAALCEEADASNRRLYVVNVENFKQSHSNICSLPAQGLRNAPLVQRAVMTNLGQWDFQPLLKDVRIPALVVEGAATNVPLDSTQEWAKSLANGRLLLIPNAGHQNWIDQPKAVISAMTKFFRGSWPTGSM